MKKRSPKKKSTLASDLLQLFMSAVLIVLGILLKKNEPFADIAVMYLAIPGITLLCGFFLNMLRYKHIWIFPILVLLVFAVQVALYYYNVHFAFSKMLILVAFVSILLTTLFYLLHVDLFKGRKTRK